jgi:hypothetical protein
VDGIATIALSSTTAGIASLPVAGCQLAPAAGCTRGAYHRVPSPDRRVSDGRASPPVSRCRLPVANWHPQAPHPQLGTPPAARHSTRSRLHPRCLPPRLIAGSSGLRWPCITAVAALPVAGCQLAPAGTAPAARHSTRSRLHPRCLPPRLIAGSSGLRWPCITAGIALPVAGCQLAPAGTAPAARHCTRSRLHPRCLPPRLIAGSSGLRWPCITAGIALQIADRIFH